MLIVADQALGVYPTKVIQHCRPETIQTNSKGGHEENLEKIIKVSLFPERVRLDREDVPDLEKGSLLISKMYTRSISEKVSVFGHNFDI